MFVGNIASQARENTNYRKVLHTGSKSQLVLMSIPPKGDIGMEVHNDTDQVIVVVAGKGKATFNGKISNVEANDILFIDAGTEHNVENVGETDLKLYTVYAPPNHPDGIVEKTKEEAQEKEPKY